MEKNLYIDASHPNETRVVLKSNGHIEDYEYEGIKNNLIKNNIYLGKVSRVEPSLPSPDSLTPPKGISAFVVKPVFTPTIPYSKASATLQILHQQVYNK